MKKCVKSILFCLTVGGVLLNPFLSVKGFAAVHYGDAMRMEVDSKDERIDLLVENGYNRGTAEALSEEQITYMCESIANNDVVDIYTCAVEVDNLAEIEAFYSYSDKELIDIGMTEQDIKSTKARFDKMYSMTDDELEKMYGLSGVERKLFRKAIDNGQSNCKKRQKYGKKLTNHVNASGSITSTEMSYTQSVIKNPSSLPNYTVTLSYNWNEVYYLAVFDDKMVAAWGGGLNTKSLFGSALYYEWNNCGGTFGSYVAAESMDIDVTPNAGVEFTFPQSSKMCKNGNSSKTRRGNASFTLYQTRKKGYDTTLVSNYCHKVISVQSADISISATDIGATISIGGAWDTTSQKRTIIGY